MKMVGPARLLLNKSDDELERNKKNVFKDQKSLRV